MPVFVVAVVVAAAAVCCSWAVHGAVLVHSAVLEIEIVASSGRCSVSVFPAEVGLESFVGASALAYWHCVETPAYAASFADDVADSCLAA